MGEQDGEAMTLQEALGYLREHLWDGLPSNLLGPHDSGPVWSILARGPTKQWTGRGLCLFLFVPILWGKVPTEEVLLITDDDGFRLAGIQSHPEGHGRVITHHMNVDDLVAHCRLLRKAACSG